MGPLDSAAKVILREVPRDLVALAPALIGRRVLSARPDDTVLPAFSLTMDKVLRLEAEGEEGELALHIEIEANWGSHVPRKTHGYWTLAHRVHEELWSLVIVLKPGNKQGEPQARYQRQAWGRHALTFDFDVVKVWELDPEDLLRRAIPGQLPLVPYAGGATEKHVERAFRALDSVNPDERRGELQAALVAFAENVFPDQNWAARMPKELYMGSTIYQLGEEAGFKLGALKSLRRALAIMCEREWGTGAVSLARRAEAADLETLEAATSLFAQGLAGDDLWQQLDSLLPQLTDSPE